MNEALQSAVETQVGTRVPGLALVVATSEQVVFSGAWGLADLAGAIPMHPTTVCNWFSMTKPATATVVVQLAEKGLIDLDCPVEHYYEPFSVMRPTSRRRAATVRHLLSHSSGLSNPIPLRWTHLATDPGPDRSRFVKDLIEKHPKLRFDPGTTAAYSNLGYLVLGEVIEAVSDSSFEDCVGRGLLNPLGMGRTGFSADTDERWATPYQRRRTVLNAALPVLLPRELIGHREGRFRSLHHFYVDGAPYGGLVGPADDAARFLRAHLGDGEVDGVRILTAESARSMRSIGARGKKLEVGLGWFRRGRNPGSDFVEHLGGGAGFWNCMRIYPERDVGVVLMGNTTAYDHDSIIRAALAVRAETTDQSSGESK